MTEPIVSLALRLIQVDATFAPQLRRRRTPAWRRDQLLRERDQQCVAATRAWTAAAGRAPQTELPLLLAPEPPSTGMSKWDAVVGAVADVLAVTVAQIDPPTWTSNPTRVQSPPAPVFGLMTGGTYTELTETAFRAHGLLLMDPH